jgi:hypothetical protein
MVSLSFRRSEADRKSLLQHREEIKTPVLVQSSTIEPERLGMLLVFDVNLKPMYQFKTYGSIYKIEPT